MFNVPPKCVELIFEQLGVAAITDQKARYIYVNRKWQEDTGISEKDAIGKYNHDLVAGSRALSAITSGKTISGDIFARKKDGTELPGIMSYIPIIDHGNTVGCFICSSFLTMDQALDFTEKLEEVTAEYDFLRKEMKKRSGVRYNVDDIIGESDSIKKLKEQIYQAGASNSTVLIEGETGTGKELVAHSIHACSLRNIFPFVKVNCSAILASLMESEFFGYEEGTFTGAQKGGKRGKFEIAHLGSIFLDEINQMDLTIQPKLLRVLQEREIERIGSSESIQVDVRIISASNVSLRGTVKRGEFRNDLYYRLNIIYILLPPLRDRREDIPLLADSIIWKLNRKMGRDIEGISKNALDYLKNREWPGNVRELQNILERAMNICVGKSLSLDEFRKVDIAAFPPAKEKILNNSAETINDKSLTEKKCTLEKEAIIQSLQSCGYNKSKTAKYLGISRTLLYQKLKKYKIK